MCFSNLEYIGPRADTMKQVRKTQRAIRQTLTERWYAFEDARKLAASDVTVDLSGDGPAYEPYKQADVDVDTPAVPENSSRVAVV